MKQNNTISAKTQKQFVIILLLIVNCALIIPSTRDCFGQSITWQKILDNDYGSSQKIQQTMDDGYIVIGNERIQGINKIYLNKLDLLGNVIWTKILGIGNSQGNWVEQCTNGGYIIGGATDTIFSTTFAYLVKTDSEGNIQWERFFKNSDLDQCYCVKQTADNGFILSVRTTNINNSVMYIKTDSVGNQQWQKIYSVPGSSVFISELQVLNYGYAAAGNLLLNGMSEVYVMKLNSVGDSLWTRRYGGNNYSGASSIDKISNSGFIIGGISRSFNPNNKTESYICKIDTNGVLIWQKTHSNLGKENCNSIRSLSNGGFLLGGISDSLDNLVSKAKVRLLDINGNSIFEMSYLPSPDYAFFNSVEITNDNGFILAGGAAYTSGSIKHYIVKTDSLLNSSPIGLININNNIPVKFRLFQNYPNPFNPSTTIRFDIPISGQSQIFDVRIEIYDMLGREVFQFSDVKSPGSYEIRFDGTDLASGMYFYKLSAGTFSDTKKMVLIK